MTRKFKTALSAIFAGGLLMSSPAYASDEKEITLIHTGDFHGHLVPRPNVRSDGDGRMEGGLASVYSVIKAIRAA